MMGSMVTEEDSFAIFDHYRGRGGNFIDTAELYPAPIFTCPELIGNTEEITGRWLQARGCRKDFIIATKVAGVLPADLNFAAKNRLTGEAILAAAEGSLRRLQLDCIDLYQIHWPARQMPVFGRRQFSPEQLIDAAPCEELVAAMGELITAGKIRHWGLSNDTAYGVMAMCEAAKRLGVPLPVTIQNDYSLCDRHYDLDVAEACHAYGLVHMPYGVLAGGYLTGKYRDGARPEAARHIVMPDFQSRAASRWHVASVISGFTRLSQMDEYLDAVSLQLSTEALEAIEKIHMEKRNPQWVD